MTGVAERLPASDNGASDRRGRARAYWLSPAGLVIGGATLLALRTAENLALSVTVGAAVYAAALALLRGIPKDVRLGLWTSKAEGPE